MLFHPTVSLVGATVNPMMLSTCYQLGQFKESKSFKGIYPKA